MTDISTDSTQNMPEYSVSELSQALKRTVEDAYSYVRVRGEVSGFKRAASGHLYMSLKDESANLDAVCWRGVAGRLSIQPEDGMEVIASGKLTTYPGRSKYQIVIDSLELAGEGALLKMLEDRRKALAAEGLFDEARKQPIPFLPETVGVVTSPTGAVIRDILHRLDDRFPRHVLLAPVLVQGEGAAAQIAAAIEGFNGLDADGAVPRPDVLIVHCSVSTLACLAASSVPPSWLNWRCSPARCSRNRPVFFSSAFSDSMRPAARWTSALAWRYACRSIARTPFSSSKKLWRSEAAKALPLNVARRPGDFTGLAVSVPSLPVPENNSSSSSTANAPPAPSKLLAKRPVLRSSPMGLLRPVGTKSIVSDANK